MSVTVYGIPNCDTVKKARTWLDGHGVAYAFHDAFDRGRHVVDRERHRARGGRVVGRVEGFGGEAYREMDRTGCSAGQLAQLDQLIKLTRDLPELNAANERAAESGNPAAHEAAFQRLIDAVNSLNALQQAVSRDLERMEQPK